MGLVHDSFADGRRSTPSRSSTTTHESAQVSKRTATCRRKCDYGVERPEGEPGSPCSALSKNGSEFTSHAFDACAIRQQLPAPSSRPGKPVKNFVIQSFSGRRRDYSLSPN